MTGTTDLFATDEVAGYQPLAARMRPQHLSQYVGQQHLLGDGKPLKEAVRAGKLHSMVLWGPPGVGKTSFARLLADECDAAFITLSAVLAGVKDIRAAVEEAKLRKAQSGSDTILFVDEVHRFNKSQQDAFLPHIEDGTVIFVGATTENPSFELNSALLSRARVYILRRLAEEDLIALLERALIEDAEFQQQGIRAAENILIKIAALADGDARRALNILEVSADLAAGNREAEITEEILREASQDSLRRFDKAGEVFYDQISALHKSVRGSDPDASLYWFCRMLDGGCDPLYIARRVVRMASEDIGNADPRGLSIALAAWDVQERLGSPEGDLSIAQAIVYLACAPKSNAVYSAYKAASRLVSQGVTEEVPMHLRNAPTSLMADAGYGDGYRYAHDEPEGFAAGESYFPEGLHGSRFYEPVNRGLEKSIAEKLEYLRRLNLESADKRYPE